MTKPNATIVVAYDMDGTIGRDGGLPWPRHREDMRRFRRATLGHPVIMGRKTYESIGSPLPWRMNIVITRSPRSVRGHVAVAASLEEALRLAGEAEPMIIGGGEIYALARPFATRILATEMVGRWGGDAVFERPSYDQWTEKSRETWAACEDGGECDFVDYRRR